LAPALSSKASIILEIQHPHPFKKKQEMHTFCDALGVNHLRLEQTQQTPSSSPTRNKTQKKPERFFPLQKKKRAAAFAKPKRELSPFFSPIKPTTTKKRNQEEKKNNWS